MSMLPSHKQGIYYLEHSRIMVKDEKLTYLQAKGAFQKYWAIPYGNTNVLLLGSGTSITQAAARLLADNGVMVAFVGGGGSPLFLASQNEYRPTEYLQKWVAFWWDKEKRLQAAKYFQISRCKFIEDSWPRIDYIKNNGLMPHTALERYRNQIDDAKDSNELTGYEAGFAKALYQILAAHFNVRFTREYGKKDSSDLFNSYLDHGNYLAYGLGGVVLWVYGIPHSMPVSHGFTRRGALVFDVADIIKDGSVLPNVFDAASCGISDQKSRDNCISFFDRAKAIPYLFKEVKWVIEVLA